MAPPIPQAQSAASARDLRLNFSEGLRECLHELAEIAEKSPHFSPEVVAILKDWSVGRVTSVHDVLIALTSIAEQVAEHRIATDDPTVKEIWRGIATLFAEEGFTLSTSRQRAR